MNILNKNTAIVIAGSWNQQILTPKWLKDNGITALEKIRIEVAISNPSMPIHFQLEKVHLHVSPPQVVVYPFEETKNSYESAETVASKLLEALWHTPINGVGYNFKFKDDKPAQKIFDRFVFKDEEFISSFNAIVKERVVKRQIDVFGKTLNLMMLLDVKEALTVDFNWHFDYGSANDAKGKIQGTFYETYIQTKEIVEKMFSE